MVDLDQTFVFSRKVSVVMRASEGIGLYPNPVSEIVNLSGVDLSSVHCIEIIDSEGQRIFEQENVASNQIFIGKIMNGTYILRLKTKTGFVEKFKFVVVH